MSKLGLKNLELVQPQWYMATSHVASLSEQLKAIDRDIRISTFGEGDPDFSDTVEQSAQPPHPHSGFRFNGPGAPGFVGPPPGGLFGPPTGLFGPPPGPSGPASGSIFGPPSGFYGPASAGIFGPGPPSGGSLFGGPHANPPSGGNLFGGPPAQPPAAASFGGGLFGTSSST